MNAPTPITTLTLATAVPGAHYAVRTASGTVYALAVAENRLSAKVVRMRGDTTADGAPAPAEMFADGEVTDVLDVAFQVGHRGVLHFFDVEARIEVSVADYCGTIRTTTVVRDIEKVEG